MSSQLRKIRLVKDTEPVQERQTTAWASLVTGYSQWHQANYDEQGNVRREQKRERERV